MVGLVELDPPCIFSLAQFEVQPSAAGFEVEAAADGADCCGNQGERPVAGFFANRPPDGNWCKKNDPGEEEHEKSLSA